MVPDTCDPAKICPDYDDVKNEMKSEFCKIADCSKPNATELCPMDCCKNDLFSKAIEQTFPFATSLEYNRSMKMKLISSVMSL